MNNIHTAYDVMKEYLITDAELDGQFQVPMLPKVNLVPNRGIDFVSSKSRSLKGHKDLTVNFYIDDKSFLQVWSILPLISHSTNSLLPHFWISKKSQRITLNKSKNFIAFFLLFLFDCFLLIS